jgi:hypothetical protein
MAIEYTWAIPRLEVAPTLDGKSDVVTAVHWRLRGRDGSNTAEVYGVAKLDPPESIFVPLADLDEATVLKWVEVAISVDEMKGRLASKLQAASTVYQADPPWIDAQAEQG